MYTSCSRRALLAPTRNRLALYSRGHLVGSPTCARSGYLRALPTCSLRSAAKLYIRGPLSLHLLSLHPYAHPGGTMSKLPPFLEDETLTTYTHLKSAKNLDFVPGRALHARPTPVPRPPHVCLSLPQARLTLASRLPHDWLLLDGLMVASAKHPLLGTHVSVAVPI